MAIIYLLTAPNGKVYVGQCKRRRRTGKIMPAQKQLQLRWKEHCRETSGCRAIKNAITKYGSVNFKVELLLEVADEYADEYERSFIRAFSSTNPKHGYNRTKGGEGGGFAIPKVRARML